MERKFLARPYYSQCAVFASPLSAFFSFTTGNDLHQEDPEIALLGSQQYEETGTAGGR